MEEPAVRAALATSGAGREVTDFIVNGQGPRSPIAMRDGKLMASGCEAHDCGSHDWAMLIASDGSGAEICYHDADAGGPPRWFAGGKVEDKHESCS